MTFYIVKYSKYLLSNACLKEVFIKKEENKRIPKNVQLFKKHISYF